MPNKLNNDVLYAVWICASVTFAVFLVRIAGRLYKHKKAYIDDYLIYPAIVFLIARCCVIHVALLNGTNNVANPETLSQEEIKNRQLGSKLYIFARLFFASFVWTMKFCMVFFYDRLCHKIPGYRIPLLLVKILLGATFIGVVASTFLECRPFNNYWQVLPTPPEECYISEAQLFTMGISNIGTDLILIIIPLPVIFRTTLPLLKKISLAGLFLIGFFVCILTLLKMPLVVQSENVSRQRTLWASLEILGCGIVVNIPVILSYFKKQKQQLKEDSIITNNRLSKRFSNNSDFPSSPIRLVHPDFTDEEKNLYAQHLEHPARAYRQELNNRYQIEVSKDYERIESRKGSDESQSSRSPHVTTSIWTEQGARTPFTTSPAGSSHDVRRH